MMTSALPFLSVSRCARHFHVSTKTVYKMVKSGELPAELFGSYVIDWPDAWACEQGPTPRDALYPRYMSDLLSRQGLAAKTHRSLRTVDRWLADGLPTRNVRDSVRLNALDAADWLAGRYGSAVALRKLRAHAVETCVDLTQTT
ncbi:MAG: DNA-binding protein [Roseovarius sp.]